jgi:hypothetical protein
MIVNALRKSSSEKKRRLILPVPAKVADAIFGDDKVLYFTGNNEEQILQWFGQEILRTNDLTWSEREYRKFVSTIQFFIDGLEMHTTLISFSGHLQRGSVLLKEFQCYDCCKRRTINSRPRLCSTCRERCKSSRKEIRKVGLVLQRRKRKADQLLQHFVVLEFSTTTVIK